ncbi:HAD family hydrolase [Hymenobacter wooponensis]|uniref:Phosphoprotein phosphatase n=1 Tax=Hymenobacter wooponensis TaxID=1525360 RepID=A0A4Z0MK04_9BACT|nr:HAD family hydrolase [Hymenobacter wooponensis]TGD79789.1 phosphoprotein phosphatase [Hymenobacter wooponensis]
MYSIDKKDKLLLILDLDETLIHASSTELDRPADFRLFDYHIYKRPHLKEFLTSCSRHFRLAIWSSASDDYVAEVTKQIVPASIPLDFVWGRSRCTYCFHNAAFEESGHTNYHSHYDYVKVLKKLRRHGYDLNKVLIVDDTPAKSKRNFGNAIYPKEYKGQSYDSELALLSDYLIQLKDAENVRSIEKRGWRNHMNCSSETDL